MKINDINITEENRNEVLLNLAKEAAKNAYCPYSRFHVGAALLTESGNVYTGCNVENSSYGAAICAERAAVCSAVNCGDKKITAAAIYGFHETNGEYPFCMPCGICRQVLAEFGSPEIIVADGAEIKTYKLSELLPFSFSL